MRSTVSLKGTNHNPLALVFGRRGSREALKPESVILQSSGGVREWLMRAVLKTAVLQGTVGSNPTPSAMSRNRLLPGHVVLFGRSR